MRPTRLFARLLAALNRLLCKHVFIGYDFQPHDDKEKCHWTCSKCGKRFTFDYGLQALNHGTITGPWVRPDKDQP